MRPTPTPRLQLLAAAVLKPGDVAVIISSGGKLPELLEVAAKARERGAAVIAITASQSPLARKADVVRWSITSKTATTHVPMVSRILHLLVIDILAVGVAMRRSPARGGRRQRAGARSGAGRRPGAARPGRADLAHRLTGADQLRTQSTK